MPDFTLPNTAFPEGTTVSVYDATGYSSFPAGGPPGSPVTSAVVTGGVVTFEGLTDKVSYFAAAKIGSEWQSVRFTVGEDFTPVPVLTEDLASGVVRTRDADDTLDLATQAELDATQAEIDADLLAKFDGDILKEASLPSSVEIGRSVVTVAASDSENGQGADFVCSGTADNETVQAALDSLKGTNGGTVRLLDGTFSFDGAVVYAPEHSGIEVIGAGMGVTTIAGDPGVGVAFFELSQATGRTLSHVTLHHFTIDGTGWTGDSSEGGFDNGTVRDVGAGVVEYLTVEWVEIHTSNDSCSGVVSFNITADVGPNRFWRVCNNIIVCDGDRAYGVKTQKHTEHVWVEDNFIELTEPGEVGRTGVGGYNCISVYGGTSFFHINDNTVVGNKNHSLIAASPANRGEIEGNLVECIGIAAEAGIEVEWKAGHSDDLRLTHNVAVVGNVVIGAYWGILVTNRDPGTFPSNDPYNVIIDGNTLSGCTQRDIMVTHGAEIAVGINTHHDTVTTALDIDDAVTSGGKAVVNELYLRGTSAALLHVGDLDSPDSLKVAPTGRLTIVGEDIYLSGGASRQIRNTAGEMKVNGSVASALQVASADVVEATSSEFRLFQKPKWDDAALVQTTVGAAGAADAPPARPEKWLQVLGDDGRTYVVPAYLAS